MKILLILNIAVAYIKTKALERKHCLGYKKNPMQKGEFSGWEDEQVWID